MGVPGFPAFRGLVPQGGCGRVVWMMGEQKGFAVVMADKLKSNWLLRSPETEQAEGRVPELPPQP